LPIALVTFSGLPNLSADDRLLLPALAGRGVHAEPAAWDDQAMSWESFDALVVRSTWNYHMSLETFMRWIGRVEALRIPLWNSPAVLRWNADKSYLRDLAAAGFDVVPTRWVRDGDDSTLAGLLADAGWTDAVLKPAVSASAFETWRVAADGVIASDESRFRQLAARRGGAMVQRFLPQLVSDGEWSLMFIAGDYSHAVLKRPRVGDFRVQHEHGGTATPRTPPSHVLVAAEEITALIPGPWLYARVDGVEIDGRFVLMELELLEPSLFLAAEPQAAERFAAAIAEVVPR
jgi:hypothetical protein